MGLPSDQTIQAKVTCYTLAKLKRIQFLIPLGLIASTLARRLPGILTLALGLAVMLAFWLVLRSAINRMGMQIVRVEGETLRIGAENVSILSSAIQRWTYSKGVASLSCYDTTYQLRPARGHESDLEACLSSLLGAPTRLERRGSPKARWFAGSAMVCGLTALVVGITYDIVPLGVIGVPTMLIGFGVFAALSTRRAVSG